MIARKYLKGFIALTLISFLIGIYSPAQAIVIFENFGPGDEYLTDTGSLICKDNVLSCVGDDKDQGDAFTPPSGNYYLDIIELALGITSLSGEGTNVLDVWLMTDVSGLPGEVIEAFNLSNAMPPYGFGNPPIILTSELHPLLTAGTQYWVIASTPIDNTGAGWNFNSIDDRGPHAFRSQSGGWSWQVEHNLRGAFRILGSPAEQPIPEPATLLLLGFGLAGLGFVRRRKQKM